MTETNRREMLKKSGLAAGVIALYGETKADAATFAAGEIIKPFDTVADMSTDAGLLIGDVAKTLGYNTQGDGGGNEYIIVAAGTGSDDGGEYLDLNASGLQAKAVFPDGALNIKQYGITGGNASTKLSDLIHKRALLIHGQYNLDAIVDFQPHRVSLLGDVNLSTFTNTGGGYLRFGAVGGTNREITKLSNFNFEGNGKIIDAQAVFPINIDACRFYRLGLGAIRFYQIYYGKLNDTQIFASQLDFENVNNYTIDGTDIHGENPLNKFAATDYACILKDCDRITFSNITLESWKNRVIHATKNKSLRFESVYIEANTADLILKSEGSSNISFDGCFLELYPSPTTAFIDIDNSNTFTHQRDITTLVSVTNCHLRLNTSTNSNFHFITADNGKAFATIKDCTLRSGSVLLNKNATADVRGLTLSTTTGDIDELKFVESLSHVDISNGNNRWVENSVMNDKSMTGGPIVSVISGSATRTTDTTTTSQNGISTKITITSQNTNQVVLQRSASEMGAVTQIGETYLFFIRAKCSHHIPLQFTVEGFYTEHTKITPIETKTQWTDYVIKTDSAVTWAQNNSGNPKIKIKLTNNSGNDIHFYIDRIDYKVVLGDAYLA